MLAKGHLRCGGMEHSPINQFFAIKVAAMLASSVATPGYPSEFWENHFIAFIDRYDGLEQELRGCEAIISELSDKSKMATYMAAMTDVNTVLATSLIIFMLLSQFLYLVICFQAEKIIEIYSLTILSIFIKKMWFFKNKFPRE